MPKNIESILTDLAIFTIEPESFTSHKNTSSITWINEGRNSHMYRTDTPLINDHRNYQEYLKHLQSVLRRELTQTQYCAVIVYYSHAKITLSKASELTGLSIGKIQTGIKKAKDTVLCVF